MKAKPNKKQKYENPPPVSPFRISHLFRISIFGIRVFFLLAFSGCPAPLRAYERLQGPTQVIYWDKTNTYNGYTLFGSLGTTYLIDMEGCIINSWPVGINPRLLDNGNLLDATNGTINGFTGFTELDWSGSGVWSYTETRTNYFPHNDFIRIYNKKLGTNTTLYIANRMISSNLCIAAGCNPNTSAYTNVTVDAIVEVAPSGTVIWEWCFFDHGIQDFDAAKSNYVGGGKSITNYPGRINLNLPGRPLTNDWLHCTSLDYNTNLDQLVITAEAGEFYVIDHGATFVSNNPASSIALAAATNGDFLYRFGDPARYNSGSPPSIQLNWTTSTTGNKQIGGASQVAWIPAGVPGAGHFLVFNNGQYLFETCPQSYIFEVNGYLNSSTNDTGAYINPTSAGYYTWSPPGHDTDKRSKSMSKQIVTNFFSMANQAFFSHTGGSAQRLPNGNMLVCSTAEGHIFEVTAAGTAVWEYINPVTFDGVTAYKRDNWPLYNAVYRASRYSSTSPALLSRTLTGTTTIAGAAPSYVSAPTISGITLSPSSPSSTSIVTVTASITNRCSISSANLAYIVGNTTNILSMTKSGAVYSAQIPAYTNGTIVHYYVYAQDEFDNTATCPAGAPTSTLAYTVYLSVVATGSTPTQTLSSLHFTESPAADSTGNIFFSDITSNTIYKWSTAGQLSIFRTNSGGANGLFFERNSNLITCEGKNGRLTSISPQTNVTVVTSTYGGSRYNEPNDLWVDPAGGVYFTDPVFFTNQTPQGGEYVYYVKPDTSSVIRVISDMVRPNGLVGTPDGKTLYVADWGSSNVYRYSINSDGTLSNKTAFASVKCDGMTMDNAGNIYMTETAILVYNAAGTLLEQITVPERPTNLEFGGNDRKTLFITTDAGSLYSLKMRTHGTAATNRPPIIAGTTITPSSPTASNTVWVTATVTDDFSIASVTLSYGTGGGSSLTNTVFQETMGASASKPWNGTFCDNSWTVNFNGGNPFEQAANANYGSGNTNGLTFKGGTTNLSDSMVTATLGIDARGNSGTVTFYVSASILTSNACWAFQLNPGSGFTTRLVETNAANHGYQLYSYTLQPGDLVSNLVMRFQFSEGDVGNRIFLDLVSMKIASGAASWTTSAMYDDGLHGDGAAGDNVYGVQIPSNAAGTTVSYYLTATDDDGLVTNSPAGAPGSGTYSYTVSTSFGNSSMRALPDTGQTISYTSTFGEDADYAIHPPAYGNNGDGTITDKVTGLTWQQTDGGEMTWENALIYSTNLNLGGHTDWRLPTAHELYSISKQGAINPAVDTNYFTVTAAEYWWSRDIEPDVTNNIWVANAGGGIGNHPRNETISAGGSKRFHVRCVRGATAPSTNSPARHFTNNGNGTITDSDTGLMWQQSEIPAATNWEGALSYAATNSLAGYADWRIPNIKELQFINDETLVNPSVDRTYFPAVTSSRYWSSTTMHGTSNEAWFLDCQYGVTSYAGKESNYWVRCVRGGTTNIVSTFTANYVRIPGDTFIMGDQFEYVDLKHYTDEIPLHNVYISTLYMATTLATVREYCDFLNAALYQGLIEVRSNIVYAVGGTNIYFYTYGASFCSRIQYANNTFTVLNNRERHPVTSVRWFGAIAFCNWLSQRGEFKPCYNLDTGDVNFTNNGFRLPTEAEWEFAAHGGLTNPYCMFPWGTNNNADGTYANWQNSGDPFESTNDYPCTTPVGFYNGALRLKSDFNWPGAQTTYQTSDGSNPYGLYDMAGNVWEWCNDWYQNAYYTNCYVNNIVTNPPGPALTNADFFPDITNGIPYRCLRGGTWWNGNSTNDSDYGHARVSNRDPSYFLGGGPPGDPYAEFSQTGFRVMRPEKLTQNIGLFLNATNACPGYTLMSSMQGYNTYLLNNAGQYVHKWTSACNPGRSEYLLTNGHLLRTCGLSQTAISTGGGEGGRLEERDWEGNLIWVYELNTSTNLSHHDIKVLPNGNVIMIACEVKTTAECIAAGFNPALLDASVTNNGGYMLPDYVIEVQPTLPYGGIVVWEWHTWDHMIQDFDNTKNNYGIVSNHVELVNLNGTGIHIPQFWNHMNAIDYNPQLDQIMLSVRGNSEIWIIDHQTTTAQAAGHTGGRYNKGGDLLYRWGCPQQYKLGTVSDQRLWQQHCCTWITTNCPNSGHILIFDNGVGRGYTSIDEIVPPVDGAGNYSRTAGAIFGPATYYWSYTNSPGTNFYCSDIGGAEREPNGNTLITYGTHGILFEINATSQTVWQYISPEAHAPMAQGATIPTDPNMAGQYLNEVFKVHRYQTSYAGLAGKDLTPRGTVETYTGVTNDTVGLGLPDTWVRSHFGTLSAVTATSSHSSNGLTDIQEYLYGLDPTVWSSRTNGIPDGWAIRYGFDPTLASIAALTNLNGYTTLQSYLADLNPTNASSILSFIRLAAVSNNIQLTWIGGSNAWQYIETCPNLLSNQWTRIYTNTPPTGITNVVIHTGAASSNLFYRIKAGR